MLLKFYGPPKNLKEWRGGRGRERGEKKRMTLFMQEPTDEPVFLKMGQISTKRVNVSSTPISSPVKPEIMAGDRVSCSLVFHLCVRHEVGKNDIIILWSEGEECTVDVSVLTTHCKPLHTHTHLKPECTVGLLSALLRNTV